MMVTVFLRLFLLKKEISFNEQYPLDINGVSTFKDDKERRQSRLKALKDFYKTTLRYDIPEVFVK